MEESVDDDAYSHSGSSISAFDVHDPDELTSYLEIGKQLNVSNGSV